MVSKMGAQYYVRYIFLLWITVVLLERQVEWAQGMEDSSATKSDDVNVPKGNEGTTAARAQDVPPRIAKSDREGEEVIELLKLAHASFFQDDYEKAILEYTKAIEKRPLRAPYYAFRGRSYGKNGNLNEAERDFRRAILLTEVSPTQTLLRLHLIHVLMQTRKYKEAIEEVILTNDHVEIAKLGDRFVDEKQFDLAYKCYNEAIRKEPENTDFLLKRGKLYLKEQKLDEAIYDFKTVLETQPDLKYARKLLVWALLDSGDIDEATKEVNLTDLLRMFFYEKEMSKLDDNELYYLAYEMFLGDKSEKALHCCTEAIKQNSKKAKHFRLRGNCHKKLGNLKSAIDDFRVVFQIRKDMPPKTDFLLEFSQLLLDSGNYLEAETVLTPIGQNNLTENDAVNLLKIDQKIREMKTQSEKLPIGGEGKDSESLLMTPYLVLPHETSTHHDDMNQEERGTLRSLATTGVEVELLEAPVQPATRPSTSDTSALGKRKERAETYSSDLQLALKNLIGARSSRDDSHDGQSDKFDMTAKIWTHDLRNITDSKQMLFARKAINDVLFEAQLGTLQRNSVIIKPSTLHKTTDTEED